MTNNANESENVRRMRTWLTNASDTEVAQVLISSNRASESEPVAILHEVEALEPVLLPVPSTSPTDRLRRFQRVLHDNNITVYEPQGVFIPGGGRDELVSIGGNANVLYYPDMPGR